MSPDAFFGSAAAAAGKKDKDKGKRQAGKPWLDRPKDFQSDAPDVDWAALVKLKKNKKGEGMSKKGTHTYREIVAGWMGGCCACVCVD